MLNFYLTNEEGDLIQEESIKKGSWINMVQPTPEEIECVVSNTKIPMDFVMDALDNYERSRVERKGDDVLIIIDFPKKEIDNFQAEYFKSIPMGIIVTKDYFVTVCLEESYILKRFTSGKVLSFTTQRKTRFALQIMQEITGVFFKGLLLLEEKNDYLEKNLNKSFENDRFFDMGTIEKSLINFQRSLSSTKNVTNKMMRKIYLTASEEDNEILADLIVEIDQALGMAEDHSNIIGSMRDIYAAVISNNMNEVMKTWTLFTIVLTAPTLVFSFYGMNVPLPFMSSPVGWVITLVLSLIFGVIFRWILIKKH